MTTTAGTPPRDLPAVAHPAWHAYCAMLNSKQAHYGFLESLDVKYKQGGIRTLAERARLETLLAEHDVCVSEFARAIKALGTADVEARDILLRYMTDVGEATNRPTH